MHKPQQQNPTSSLLPASPRELGYRWPAEWEPHQATWLSWPHNRETWPGHFEGALQAFIRLVRVLSRSEPVHINVNDAAMEEAARVALRGAVAEDITFHQFATNDAWCRDHGAIILNRRDDRPLVFDKSSGRTLASPQPAPRIALDWEYNAWGAKYPPFALDNAIPSQMARQLRIPCLHCSMVLEGGSIDGNGAGTLLTTESCLLHPNRNSQFNRETIETQLCAKLAVDRVVWLAEGIVGDDTDGHVDDFARFVAPDRVVLMVEENRQDQNYNPLQENFHRLSRWRDEWGRSLEIVPLPSPRPIEVSGKRLPASYANFYIANQVVVVPQFQDPLDRVACDILADCFPSREVVGIDCTELIWGLGALHCLTQQVPAATR